MEKYNLELYEAELIFLYKILKERKPHLVRVENQIKDIFKNNSEFNFWKDIIEGEK